MKYTFLLVTLLTFWFTDAHAQRYPIKQNGLWGAINAEGEIKIPAKYDFLRVLPDSEYAEAERDGKKILLGPNGREIATDIQEVKALSPAIAVVRKAEGWQLASALEGGSLDLKAEKLLPLGYDFFAFQRKGKWGVMQANGKEIYPPKADTVFVADTVRSHRSRLFLAKVGETLSLCGQNCPPERQGIERHYALPNGYVLFKKDGKWGGISGNEKHSLPNEFRRFAFLMPSFIALQKYNGEWQLYSDLLHRFVITEPHSYFAMLDDYYALGGWFIKAKKQGNKMGLLDERGKLLLPYDFDDLQSPGRSFISAKKGEKWGLLKKNKQEILPFEYDFILNFPEALNYTKIVKGKKEGFVNARGEITLPCHYDVLEVYRDFVLGYQGEQVTLFRLDEWGKVKHQTQYAHFNDTGLKRQDLQGEVNFDWKVNPDADGNRWEQAENGKFYLVQNNGQPVFNTGFSTVVPHPLLGLAFATHKDREGRTRKGFLIDYRAGKVRFASDKIKTLALFDFAENDIARAAMDSVKYNALVRKNGELIRSFPVGGSPAKIDTMSYFSEGLLWVKAGGKCGVVNALGDVILPFQYDEVTDFRNGRAQVRKGEKWGYVNAEGKSIVPVKYNHISPFINGFAVVILEGKYGLISEAGQEVIPLNYERLSFVKRGVVRVQQGEKWGALNTEGKEVIAVKYDSLGEFIEGIAPIKLAGRFGFIQDNGKVLIEPKLAVEAVSSMRNGIAWLGKGRVNRPQDPVNPVSYRLNGYIRKDGSFIVDGKYESIQGFEAVHRNKKGAALAVRQGKTGLLGADGQEILPCEYDEVGREYEKVFRTGEGVVRVVKSGKTGYINAKAEFVLPCNYTKVGNFAGIYAAGRGVAEVKQGRKWGAVNAQGKVAIPLRYDFAGMASSNDTLLAVRMGKRWGVINDKEKEIVPIRYKKVRFLVQDDEQLLIEVYSDSLRHDYLSPENKIVAQVYGEAAGAYAEGKIPAKKDGKWGFADSTGAWVIAPQFDEARAFGKGLAPVIQNGKWGYVNESGKVQISPAYEQAHPFTAGGCAQVRKNGKWGLIRANGSFALPAEYEEIRSLGEGFFAAQKKDGNEKLEALVSPSGKLLTKFEFSELGEFGEGLFPAKLVHKKREKQKYGYLNAKGELAIPHKFNYALPFSGDMARVKTVGQRWSFIDKKGIVKIASKYNYATDFSEGLAFGDATFFDPKNQTQARSADPKLRVISPLYEGVAIAEHPSLGYLHVDKTLQKCYAQPYDTLTRFCNGVALAKAGEVWQLSRISTTGMTDKTEKQTKEEMTTRLNFTRQTMLKYKADYPERLKKAYKVPAGTIRDLGWKLVREGRWKLIDRNGKFVRNAVFSSAKDLEKTYIHLEVSGGYGFYDAAGEQLAAPVFEVRYPVGDGLIRVERGDQIGYLHPEKGWLWKPQH